MKPGIKSLLAFVAVGMLAGCGTDDVATPVSENAASSGTNSADAEAVVATPAIPGELDGVEGALPGGFCALDAINGGDSKSASAKGGADVWFSGWLADDDKQVPADARFVFRGKKNSYAVPVATGVARPDVALALSSEALSSSGYNLLVRIEMAPGSYQLSVVSGGTTEKECDLDARLLVVE